MTIVANVARTRAVKDARTVPFSALATAGEETAVGPERFRGPEEAFAGHWRQYPVDWRGLPQEVLLSRETIEVVTRAIDGLPSAQRTVIRLRDVDGWSADEVCTALELTAANQRVLLHRARSRVRAALEGHLDG